MRASVDAAERLGHLQASFSRKLMQRGGAAPAGLTPAKRFRVYRNTMFASLINALRARYPVIERLTGEDFFEAAAGHFIEAHPPRSPVLIDYGEGFSDFLESFEPAGALPYLADVARLEWLRHRAYHAADREALRPSDLARAPSDRVFALHFEFHPSAALIVSPYPIVSIWETNAHDAETRPIGADLAGEAALVVRPDYDVLVVRLDGPSTPSPLRSPKARRLAKPLEKPPSSTGSTLRQPSPNSSQPALFAASPFLPLSRRLASCLV